MPNKVPEAATRSFWPMHRGSREDRGGIHFSSLQVDTAMHCKTADRKYQTLPLIESHNLTRGVTASYGDIWLPSALICQYCIEYTGVWKWGNSNKLQGCPGVSMQKTTTKHYVSQPGVMNTNARIVLNFGLYQSSLYRCIITLRWWPMQR